MSNKLTFIKEIIKVDKTHENIVDRNGKQLNVGDYVTNTDNCKPFMIEEIRGGWVWGRDQPVPYMVGRNDKNSKNSMNPMFLIKCFSPKFIK